MNHADIRLLSLKQRPLLNMQLVAGVQRDSRRRMLALIADSRQRLADANAVAILPRQGIGFAEHPGPNAGGQHRRSKTRPLFVGPVHQNEVALGGDAAIVKGTQRLQPGEHAIDAVVVAAQRLGVTVRAGEHRGEIGVAARPANKHIPQSVNVTAKARFTRPGREQVASAAILIAQRQTGHPASRRCAKRGKLVKGLPQARTIHL